MFRDMCTRQKFVKGLGLSSRRCTSTLKRDLEVLLDQSTEDSKFILEELFKVNAEYEEKLKSGSPKSNTMFALCWDINELTRLKVDLQEVRVEIGALLEVLSNPENVNVPVRVGAIRDKLEKTIGGVTRFKRIPATHMFVIMISCELRNHKPYAIPIQCLPCSALKEGEIRQIINNVLKEMTVRRMNVTGFVCNGEFNYLRSRGYTRPLSILQIRSQVKNKYSKKSRSTLISLLSPKRLIDGTVSAIVPSQFVPNELLEEILTLQGNGISFTDIIDRLRPRTVPFGCRYHYWNPGDNSQAALRFDMEEEDLVSKLRSILAQLEYSYEIKQWDQKGVPFSTYFYVPEIHPETNQHFLEREDEAHVFKRIATSTRKGGPDELCLERYVEALSDETSGLTYPVLIGSRKQSVMDAERLFSPTLVDFMEKKGYLFEANYIRVIWNWRRSCDERGLSELQRCRFNYEFLNYILDELIPWHRDSYDLSTLEVTRKIDNIRGFTKETLVAVTTNIESREWCRQLRNRKPEHPRSGTSDDVECFFSVMRDVIGRDFTTKQVKYGFRKVCNEFMKRLDRDLPFYYHTSSHTRFQEGPLPDFDEAATKRKRKGRNISRREQSSAFAPRRATMPVRGSISTRAQFHNVPIELPPPPCGPFHLHDHTY